LPPQYTNIWPRDKIKTISQAEGLASQGLKVRMNHAVRISDNLSKNATMLCQMFEKKAAIFSQI
jgi:hypothetical protein